MVIFLFLVQFWLLILYRYQFFLLLDVVFFAFMEIRGKICKPIAMEGLGSDGAAVASPLAQWRSDFARAFQYYLDRSTPHTLHRWLGTLVVAMIYILRVYYVQGFYVVSYGLGIYVLNLLIGFFSPKVDPELEALDGASLPTKGADEFRPFVRRLPEFKFW